MVVVCVVVVCVVVVCVVVVCVVVVYIYIYGIDGHRNTINEPYTFYMHAANFLMQQPARRYVYIVSYSWLSTCILIACTDQLELAGCCQQPSRARSAS